MSRGLKDTMGEALRLTRDGRISDATAEIQRALGGLVPSGGADDVGSGGGHTTERLSIPGRSPEGARMQHGAHRASQDAGVGGVHGRFLARSHSGAAGTRAYKLFVPDGLEAGAPLVVMLHGCTQSADDIAAGTRMNGLAAAHGFLVAYPEQASHANGQRCWNWFEAKDQRRGAGEPEILAGITRGVAAEYGVAHDRTFAAGMSAGGAMAAILATEYPDLFAAVGVHSGLAPGVAHDMPSAFSAMRGGSPGRSARGIARPVPAIVFHGDRDGTVNPANAEHLERHLTAGMRGQPTVRRGRATGGRPFTLATRADARGRVLFERWTVHGLGHAWSGGSRSGSFTDPEGPDASAEMVRFFLQQKDRG